MRTASPLLRRLTLRPCDRLVSATLCCRACGRAAGDVVGYAGHPLGEACFIPLPSGMIPHALDGELRCARCRGQLFLDDVELLGRSARLSEFGGLPLAQILVRASTARSARRYCVDQGSRKIS